MHLNVLHLTRHGLASCPSPQSASRDNSEQQQQVKERDDYCAYYDLQLPNLNRSVQMPSSDVMPREMTRSCNHDTPIRDKRRMDDHDCLGGLLRFVSRLCSSAPKSSKVELGLLICSAFERLHVARRRRIASTEEDEE